MKNFGIYIHWPFCLSKCPYCDFNSHVRAHIDEKRWITALKKELNYWNRHLPFQRGVTLTSIFFGGGTPSLMDPKGVQEILDNIRGNYPHPKDLEITLEANPNTFDQKRFEAFHKAGINRLSLGIQSFDENELKFLGRTHSVTQAHRALKTAHDTFPRFSLDLIYGLPGQSLETWMSHLGTAMTYRPKHLSAYQLTFEENTAFYTRFQRGELHYPTEPQAIDFYVRTQRFLRHHGLQAYETSNYSAPRETSQHNLLYWRGAPYLGIGPGAHGRLWAHPDSLQHQFLRRFAQKNYRAPEIWLDKIESIGNGLQSLDPLTPDIIFEEWVLMGLRLREGLPLTQAEKLTGKSWQEWCTQKHLTKKIQALQTNGLVRLTDHHLTLSFRGMLQTNAIVRWLLS